MNRTVRVPAVRQSLRVVHGALLILAFVLVAVLAAAFLCGTATVVALVIVLWSLVDAVVAILVLIFWREPKRIWKRLFG
jgi:hypothetical protein